MEGQNSQRASLCKIQVQCSIFVTVSWNIVHKAINKQIPPFIKFSVCNDKYLNSEIKFRMHLHWHGYFFMCNTSMLEHSVIPNPYCSNWSPKSSSPSSSSSPAFSPINSESSSNGGRSLPGLEVRGSVLRPRDPREGLVAAEKGSEDVSSCKGKK